MSPFEVLRQDHSAIRSVLEKLRILPESERSQRADTFQQLETHLELHFDLKQNFFYPALQHDPDSASVVQELQNDEKTIRQLAAQMAGTSSPRYFSALLSSLREKFDDHVTQEEEVLFIRARSVLDADEWDRIVPYDRTKVQGSSFKVEGSNPEPEP